MSTLKITLLVLIICISSLYAFSQTKDTIQDQHMEFFKSLTSNGGLWIAENPKLDITKEGDYSHFILEAKQNDALSITAKIKGIDTKKDTLTFWTFSEFYAPHKKKNIFYQRSPDGLYYVLGEAQMTSKERYCEMSFYYSGGEYLKHKDTHTFISENEMISKSYDFDPRTNEWINGSILIWKRKN